MKIAYTIHGTFNSGGMERVLCNKANWLVANGYDITIITTDQQNKPCFFDFDPRIRQLDLGINFTQTNGFNIISKTLQYFKKQRAYRKKLEHVARIEKFDIMISMFGAEAHWLPKLKDNSKKIAEIHFSKFFREQQNRGGLWRLSDMYRSKQDEKAIRLYDQFVVLTHEDKGYWGSGSNIVVIPNATSFISKTMAELSNKVAIAVGRLTFQKGFDMLVETWRIVGQKHQDWTLRIFGDGEDKAALTKQATGLNVEFKGTVKNIESELQQSSIYLLSSRYEGLPMVMLESMGCGVPSVAFACKCGPRDLMENSTSGILIEQDNIEKFAEAICCLIEHDQARREMGQNARKLIIEHYTEEVVMKQWVELFNRLK